VVLLSSESEIKIIGKCCENTPRYSGLYNNEPLDNFIVLLCSDHAFEESYTRNLVKLEKLGGKR